MSMLPCSDGLYHSGQYSSPRIAQYTPPFRNDFLLSAQIAHLWCKVGWEKLGYTWVLEVGGLCSVSKHFSSPLLLCLSSLLSCLPCHHLVQCQEWSWQMLSQDGTCIQRVRPAVLLYHLSLILQHRYDLWGPSCHGQSPDAVILQCGSMPWQPLPNHFVNVCMML